MQQLRHVVSQNRALQDVIDPGIWSGLPAGGIRQHEDGCRIVSAQEQIYKALKSKEAKRAILATDKPDDLAIESLANLRTALHFGMMEVKNNCIMIAGPGPHVGKSFISVNLAAVLASNEKKVLLIDGDLR